MTFLLCFVCLNGDVGYQGHQNAVVGAGHTGTHFYPNINGHQRGHLFQVEESPVPGLPVDLTKLRTHTWRFTSQTGEFNDLLDYFEALLISWYQ